MQICPFVYIFVVRSDLMKYDTKSSKPFERFLQLNVRNKFSRLKARNPLTKRHALSTKSFKFKFHTGSLICAHWRNLQGRYFVKSKRTCSNTSQRKFSQHVEKSNGTWKPVLKKLGVVQYARNHNRKVGLSLVQNKILYNYI